MTDNLIFVSYSRKEFYFTESLVLHLQRQSIDAWFDVQQLEPGIGWKTDIQDGLEKCKALVLVASQSSLASPYVKVEVEAAQKANKPIHVVLFEPLTLTPELSQPTSLIDFTQGFDRGVMLLVAAIREQTAHHDPPPPLSPPYLPAGVLVFKQLMRERVILWWVLLVASIIVLLRPLIYVLNQEYVTDSGSAALMLFVIPVLSAWVLFSLLPIRHLANSVSSLQQRRDIPFKQWVSALNFRVTAFIYIGMLAFAYTLAFKSALFLLLLLPAVYLFVTTLKGDTGRQWMQAILNPDLLRWCHLGNEPPYDLRIIVNQPALPEDLEVDVHYIVEKTSNDDGSTMTREVVTGVSVAVKGVVPSPKTYRLYDTPQINAVAADIRAIFKRNAFQELTDSTTEPNYHILLLSPWTQTATAEQLMQQHPLNTLPVLVSPTNLSLLPNITTLQLVDFRKRYEPQLASALQYLHTQNAQQRSVFSIAVLPIRVSAIFPLREIRPIQNILGVFAALCFFLGTVGFLSLVFPQPINLVFALRALAYLICLGLGVRFLRTQREVSNLVPQSRQTLTSLAVFTTLVATGMFIAGLQPHLIMNNANIGNQLTWRIFSSVFLVIMGIGLLFQVRRAFRRGLIANEPQPILGIPLKAVQAKGMVVKQAFIIVVITVFAYIGVIMLTDNVRDDRVFANAATLAPLVIGGIILALIVIAILTGAARSSRSSDDPVFAISDAPALRSHLQKVLRKPAF